MWALKNIADWTDLAKIFALRPKTLNAIGVPNLEVIFAFRDIFTSKYTVQGEHRNVIPSVTRVVRSECLILIDKNRLHH